MIEPPNLHCDNCGYEMWAGPMAGTIDVAVIWFCPTCKQELRRRDPLGEIEAEQQEQGTFQQFLDIWDASE